MALEVALRYPQISSRSYEHPADRAATSALHAIPWLEGVIKRFAGLGLEGRLRQVVLGNAVRLGPDQVPDIWGLHVRAASRLDLEASPLFISANPFANAVTFGMRSPTVVVMSSMVVDRDAVEVEAVLAHELGHVLSNHLTYSTLLAILHQLVRGVFSDIPLAGLPLQGLYLALLEWNRAAELSCDRAAALEVEDPVAVCRLLMRMAGGAVPDMNVDAFIRQAAEYVDEDDLFARRARFVQELGRTHPASVRRVRELVRWVESGDYDRIRSGSYVRRGDEPSPSAEFDAAVRHYRERFVDSLERTVGGINKLAGQVSAWLRRSGADDGTAAEPGS